MTAARAYSVNSIETDPTFTNYIVIDRENVMAFLCERPAARSMLEAAPQRIEQAFGQKLPLRLSVFRDREEPSHAEIVVEVLTGREGEDAWSASEVSLRRLHDMWLAKLPREAARDILFVAEPS